MSATDQPSEEELRAAYEAEVKKIRVEQIVLEQVVTLINLGMRRTGLTPGTEDEQDAAQVRVAVEAVRALLPLVEQTAPSQATPIREALSQLQLAYVQLGSAPPGGPDPGQSPPGQAPPPPPPGAGAAPATDPGSPPASDPGSPPASDPASPGEPGPAQRSGRLWIPGQS